MIQIVYQSLNHISIFDIYCIVVTLTCQLWQQWIQNNLNGRGMQIQHHTIIGVKCMSLILSFTAYRKLIPYGARGPVWSCFECKAVKILNWAGEPRRLLNTFHISYIYNFRQCVVLTRSSIPGSISPDYYPALIPIWHKGVRKDDVHSCAI